MADEDLAWDAEVDGVCALPIRVLRDVEWGFDDEVITIHLEPTDRQVRFKPRIAPVLEALDGTTDLPSLVEKAMAADPTRSRSGAIRSVRHLVAGLAQQGYLEIVLPAVPDVLGGRYRRVEELGRGGIGVVWLCEDLEAPSDPAHVVVKHAWNWSTAFEVADRNVRAEARALAPVDHDHVVSLIDTFEQDGRFHLIRSYVEGHELGRQVMDQGPPRPAHRRRLTRQVADILAGLHAASVLCLDVKPANFLIPAGGEGPVFFDLGHARVLEGPRVDLEGPWGTRGFIAPEILEAQVATQKSDIYGLGRFHAFLILAREPSQRWDEATLAEKLADAGAHEDEMAFISACCRRDPGQRPSHALEAADLLA